MLKLKELKRRFEAWLYNHILQEAKKKHEVEVVHAVLKDSQAWFIKEALRVEEAHKQEIEKLQAIIHEMQDESVGDCEEVEDSIKCWDDANEQLNVAHSYINGLLCINKSKDAEIQQMRDEVDTMKRKLELAISLKEEAYADYAIVDAERKEKEEECLAMQRALEEAGVTLGIKVKKNTGNSARAQAYKNKGEIQKERTVKGLQHIATSCNIDLSDEKKDAIRKSLGYSDTSELDKAIQEGSKILKEEVAKKKKKKKKALQEHPCMYKECADCPELDTCVYKKDAEDIEDVPMFGDDEV